MELKLETIGLWLPDVKATYDEDISKYLPHVDKTDYTITLNPTPFNKTQAMTPVVIILRRSVEEARPIADKIVAELKGKQGYRIIETTMYLLWDEPDNKFRQKIEE